MFSNILYEASGTKQLWKSNFIWNIHEILGQKIDLCIGHMAKIANMPIIGIIPSNFSSPELPMTLKLGVGHQGVGTKFDQMVILCRP